MRVFVCHSSRDGEVVRRFVDRLESSGLECWVSYRDIPPGADWAETIYDAIDRSAVTVLLFTENSGTSRQIRNELDIATNLDKPLLPVRLDDSPASRGISYFADSHQWLDARDDPDGAADRLAQTLLRTGAEDPGGKDCSRSAGASARRAPALLLAFTAVVLAAGTLLLFRGSRGPADTSRLLNLVAGGTDSWDTATDVTAGPDDGFTVCGVWDHGFWSEWWVARFDGAGDLVWSWSDSLAGEDRPLLLPAAGGDVITAAGEYADFDHTGFPVRLVRLDSLGSVKWEVNRWVEWEGAVQPEAASFEMTPDSLLLLYFTLRGFTDRPEQRSTFQFSFDIEGGFVRLDTIRGTKEAMGLVPLESGGLVRMFRRATTGANGIELVSHSGDVIEGIEIGDIRSHVLHGLELPGGDLLIFILVDSYGPERGVITAMRFCPGLTLKHEKTYGGNLRDGILDALVLPSGNVLACGFRRSGGDGSRNGWVFMLDGELEMLWERVISLGGEEAVWSVDVMDDGTILACGRTTAFGQPDAWILMMGPDGSWNGRVQIGLDLFVEDWERGFIDRSVWEAGRNRNYSPFLYRDSLTGNHSLDANNVPLVSIAGFPPIPGVCFSAEARVPDMGGAAGRNWLAAGITSSPACEFLADPEGVPVRELRWDYTPGTSAGNSTVTAVSRTGGRAVHHAEHDSLRLVRSAPQELAIEVCTRTVRFHLNGRLFHEDSLPLHHEGDSIRVYAAGSSMSVPHSIDNVRVYRRRW